MRILKHGNMPEYEFTCPRCGCVFVANFNEYSLSEWKDCITHKVIFKFADVYCPECGQYIKRHLEEQ